MFIIATILLFVATPAIYNFLWKAIQRGEMFGKYQAFLDWVENNGYWKLADFFGKCQLCFAHFIGWCSYIVWAITGFDKIGWFAFVLWIPLVTLLWYINFSSKLLLDILAEKAKELKDKNDRIDQENYAKQQEILKKQTS